MTNYQRNFSTGEVEVERDGATLYHKTEYRERRDHYAFYNVNAHVAGFDTDREIVPRPLQRAGASRRCPRRGSRRTRWPAAGQPIASHGLDVKLAPGEEKTFVFTLGYVENPRDEKWEKPGVINKKPRPRADREVLATPEQVDAAIEGARRPLVEAALELLDRIAATRS